MRNKPNLIRQLSIPALTLIAFSGMATGQASQLGRSSIMRPDVFAPVHESLSDAADRTLAAVLADKPWMKSVAPGEVASTRLSSDDGNQHQRLRAAVDRVQRLRPMIEPILREQRVPPELSAVVLVESGGLATAVSPKGARGLWQFMPDTARRYGLVVSSERDDRLDMNKSTRAAARYLRDLHRQFGDWQLAFAAYNAGEQAVGRAMNHNSQRSFSAIQSALPRETRKYVPAVMAAIMRLQVPNFNVQISVVYASVRPD